MSTRLTLSLRSRNSLLVLLPIIAGSLLGKLSDSSATTALLLLMEPLLWLVVIYVGMWLLMKKQWRTAAFFLASACAGITLIHTPYAPRMRALPELSPWTDSVESALDCVETPGDSLVPIRVLQWTLSPEKEVALSASEIYRMQPDILILSGLSSTELADQVAELLDGEARHVSTSSAAGVTSVVLRGQFMDCGSAASMWSLRPSGETPGVYLFWAQLMEAGPTPIIVARTEGLGGLGDIAAWHNRLGQVQGEVTRILTEMNQPRVLFLGDIAAPRSFQSLPAALQELGLTEARLPASWPTQLGPMPLPGLHPLDRLWVGAAWTPGESRRVRVDGQPRALIQSDLQSRTPLQDPNADGAPRSGP